jgi:glucose-1-phosphate cytidylyltransferase
MKTVLLAGGLGTRISEESHLRPKPMIEIGGYPILWHIMKIYSHYGFNEFIVCAGYRQHEIKRYFADYYLRNNDVTFDFANDGNPTIHSNNGEPWKVTIVNTGLGTMTGGRVKRVRPYVGDETFMLTYGDGVCDVDINAVLNFHRAHKRMITLTGVNVSQRFGILESDEQGLVCSFREKDDSDNSMINGGFMVVEPSVFDCIEHDQSVLEKDVLEHLVERGELAAFRHQGFWQCMDTQRDKDRLEALWNSGAPPWKVW